MKTSTYTAKLSSQGQITLPKAARDRLRVQPGNFISIKVVAKDALEISDELPIESAFGSLGTSLTGGQDAAAYTRTLRRSMEQSRFSSND